MNTLLFASILALAATNASSATTTRADESSALAEAATDPSIDIEGYPIAHRCVEGDPSDPTQSRIANGFMILKPSNFIRLQSGKPDYLAVCVNNGVFVDRKDELNCAERKHTRHVATGVYEVLAKRGQLVSLRPIYKPSDVESGKFENPVAIEVLYCNGPTKGKS